MKIAGSESGSISQRCVFRIHTKMSWIRSTGGKDLGICDLSPPSSGKVNAACSSFAATENFRVRGFEKSYARQAVFRSHDILVWIRIRGSMLLTSGSGSGMPKNMLIRIRIKIRIRNTGGKNLLLPVAAQLWKG
jgi:hypothetical protein